MRVTPRHTRTAAFVFALGAPADWAAWQHTVLPEGDVLTFADAAAGTYRAAVLRDGRLEAVVLVGPTPTLPSPVPFTETVVPSAALLTSTGGTLSAPVVMSRTCNRILKVGVLVLLTT